MWVNGQQEVLRWNFDACDNTFDNKWAFQLQMFSRFGPMLMTGQNM